MKLRIGDIIIVHGKGLISELIEEVSNGIYSHVAIYVGNGCVIEAEGFKKTGYAQVSKYAGQADVFRYNYLSDVQQQNIVKYLKGQIGGRYDWKLLLFEFIRYTFNRTLRYKENFRCHICSMLAKDAYINIKIYLTPGLDCPSPNDISESRFISKVGSI